jgi:hypothetical protein
MTTVGERFDKLFAEAENSVEYWKEAYETERDEGKIMEDMLAAKDAEIATLRVEVARLSRAFAASNETNENLQEDLEFYRDLLCVCKTCQSSPCTGGCIVKRQAKIEVLNKILDNAVKLWEPDPTIPDRISQDIDRPALIEQALHAELKQLEDRQCHK